MHFVSFTIEIYYDAQPYERQMIQLSSYSIISNVGSWFRHDQAIIRPSIHKEQYEYEYEWDPVILTSYMHRNF